MNMISVREVIRRYHISQSQRDYKQRLDSLTENLIREYLEVALNNSGCRYSDILCIRYLNLPISFDPHKTDLEIFKVWLNDLEIAITNMLAKGYQQQWLRYPSLVAALISVARCLDNRHLDDQWAWQQIGIIPQGQYNLSEVKTHWIAYLSNHKDTVPAVLSGVTKDGVIQRMVTTGVFDLKDVVKLVDLNIEAFGVSVNWRDIFVNINKTLTITQNLSSKSTEQLLHGFNELNNSWKSLFSGSDLNIFIDSVFLQKFVSESYLDNQTEKLQVLYGLMLMSKSSAIVNVAVSQNKVEAQLVKWFETYRLCLSAQQDSDSSSVKQKRFYQPKALALDKANTANMQSPEGKVFEPPSKLVGYVGGLLFVLNLLKEESWNTSLLNLIAPHDSSSVVLKKLCSILLPDFEEDVVLSVFNGEIFEDLSKAPANCCFSERQLTELNQFANSIKLEVAKRLTGANKSQVEGIFAAFSKKTVTIEFAPGWVNVFYSLDDVDTKIRASGFDLDPGFIPWLGYVVTFYYE